jgi:hypothetical protein
MNIIRRLFPLLYQLLLRRARIRSRRRAAALRAVDGRLFGNEAATRELTDRFREKFPKTGKNIP